MNHAALDQILAAGRSIEERLERLEKASGAATKKPRSIEERLARLAARRSGFADADWKEGDHPRASNGQFGSGGGGASKPAHDPTSSDNKFFGHLKGIDKLPSPKEVRQSFSTWEEAEAMGNEGREQLASALESVAKKVPLHSDIAAPEHLNEEHERNGKAYFFLGPNKAQNKATAKVENDYHGDWSKLKDMVRATVSVEHPDQLKGVIDQMLEAGIEFAAQPKDNISKPMASGYRDLNTLIKLPNGMIAELQFNVKSMMVAKVVAHDLYDEQIKLTQKNLDKPREEWPKEEAAQYEELDRAQQAIYNPAWDKASKRAVPS
jgi:hypothetical protein